MIKLIKISIDHQLQTIRAHFNFGSDTRILTINDPKTFNHIMNDCNLANESISDYIKNQLLIVGMSADSLWETIKNNDFDNLQFGGGPNTFPNLKRSGATLQFRVADDSKPISVDTMVALNPDGTVSVAPESVSVLGTIKIGDKNDD